MDVVLYGRHQRRETVKGIAPDALLGDFGEPAFHLVEPGGAGRREVQMIARPFFEPGGDFGRLMRAVVIEDQMHVATGGHAAVNLVEEAQELLLPMAGVASPDDFTGGDIERRKE